MEFGEKLQALRKERGISQESLAEQLGVSRQAVSKWESGAAFPETEKILTLCRMYGLSADDLLLDTGRPAETPPPRQKIGGRWVSAALAGALVLSLTAGLWQAEQLARWKSENLDKQDRLETLQQDLTDRQNVIQDLQKSVTQLQTENQQLVEQLAAPSAPESVRAVEEALRRYFYEFGQTWRLDFLPEFEAGSAPAESADYLMWAYTVNAGNWGAENTGTMSRDYVSDRVLAHFAVPDLAHTPLWKTWNFDGETYTVVPQGIKELPIYLFRSLELDRRNGAVLYELELVECGLADDVLPEPRHYADLAETPPQGLEDSRLTPLRRQRITFTWGFNGPVFCSNQTEEWE